MKPTRSIRSVSHYVQNKTAAHLIHILLDLESNCGPFFAKHISQSNTRDIQIVGV